MSTTSSSKEWTQLSTTHTTATSEASEGTTRRSLASYSTQDTEAAEAHNINHFRTQHSQAISIDVTNPQAISIDATDPQAISIDVSNRDRGSFRQSDVSPRSTPVIDPRANKRTFQRKMRRLRMKHAGEVDKWRDFEKTLCRRETPDEVELLAMERQLSLSPAEISHPTDTSDIPNLLPDELHFDTATRTSSSHRDIEIATSMPERKDKEPPPTPSTTDLESEASSIPTQDMARSCLCQRCLRNIKRVTRRPMPDVSTHGKGSHTRRDVSTRKEYTRDGQSRHTVREVKLEELLELSPQEPHVEPLMAYSIQLVPTLVAQPLTPTGSPGYPSWRNEFLSTPKSPYAWNMLPTVTEDELRAAAPDFYED